MRSSHLGLTLCVALTSAMGCQRNQEAPERPQEAPVAAIPLEAPAVPTPRGPGDVVSPEDVTQADEAEVAEDGGYPGPGGQTDDDAKEEDDGKN